MSERSERIASYFNDNIELERNILKCENTKDIIREIFTSGYFKNLNREMHVFDKDRDDIIDENHEDKTYHLNVNLRINLAIRNLKIKNLPHGTYHKHNYFEMIYVYEGSYSQEVHGKIVTLNAGEGCMLSPNTEHRDFPIESNDTILFFCFSHKFFHNEVYPYVKTNKVLEEFVHEIFKQDESIKEYLVFKSNETIDNFKVLISILDEYFNPDIGSKVIVLGYIARLLHILTKKYDSTYTVKVDTLKSKGVFGEIEKYIDDNLINVSREKIAQELHYNPNYINSIIKNRTGLTFSEYVSQRKLERASKLIKDTDLSINKIIRDVGYINKSYFYKIFVAKYGIRPQEFRDMVRGKL